MSAQDDFAKSEAGLAAAIQSFTANIAQQQAKAIADARAAWEADDDAKWQAAHAQLDALTQQLQAGPPQFTPSGNVPAGG